MKLPFAVDGHDSPADPLQHKHRRMVPVHWPALASAVPVGPRQRHTPSTGQEWGFGSSRAEHITGCVNFALVFSRYRSASFRISQTNCRDFYAALTRTPLPLRHEHGPLLAQSDPHCPSSGLHLVHWARPCFICAQPNASRSAPAAPLDPLVQKKPSRHSSSATFTSILFMIPARHSNLSTAPISQWNAILASAPCQISNRHSTPCKSRCHAKGVDTPPALLQSAVAAMKVGNLMQSS